MNVCAIMWRVVFKELRGLTNSKGSIKSVNPCYLLKPTLSFSCFTVCPLVLLSVLVGIELNPLELNVLYENLYDLGTMLQSIHCMGVFEEGFRPWPHIYKDKGRAKKFYNAIDAHLALDLQRLRPNVEQRYHGRSFWVFR